MTNYAFITPNLMIFDKPDWHGGPISGPQATRWAHVAGLIANHDIDILCVYTWLPGDMPEHWVATEPGPTGWITVTVKEPVRRHIHLCILDRATNDEVIGGVIVGNWGPGREATLIGYLLDRFLTWERLTGAAYHTKPAVAAVASIRASVPHRSGPPSSRIRWRLQHPATAEWWQPPANIHDLGYRWPGLTMLLPDQPVQHFDMRNAYLAAAAAVTLPFGQLTRDDNGREDCGYYRVRVDVNYPARAWLPVGDDGTMWVCAPTLALLREKGIAAEVLEAWVTTGRKGRILRPWAESWRTAMALQPTLAVPLKHGYTQALGGLLNVRRGTIYRPDWRHMIIDQVRASILRRIFAAGGAIDPCKIDVDSIYYVTDADTPFGNTVEWLSAKLGVGDHIGNMRYLGQTTVGAIR